VAIGVADTPKSVNAMLDTPPAVVLPTSGDDSNASMVTLPAAALKLVRSVYTPADAPALPTLAASARTYLKFERDMVGLPIGEA
jgi:hypothetical protein